MVFIAACSQRDEDLLDDPACHRIGTGVICDDKKAAPVVFVGYAAWRRPEHEVAFLSDEQVWCIRNSEIRLVEPRSDLADQSPDGLSWGYFGSAASQLSIAILMEVLDDWPRVQKVYDQFTQRFVARLPQDRNWMVEGAIILRIVRSIEEGR